MGRKRKKEIEPVEENGGIIKTICSLVLLTAALTFVLSLFGQAGIVGEKIDSGLGQVFGLGRYLIPILLVIWVILYLTTESRKRFWTLFFGMLVLYISLLTTLHFFNDVDQMAELAAVGQGGGLIGMNIAFPLASFLGIAAFPVILAMWLIGLKLTFNVPFDSIYDSLMARFRTSEEEKQKRKEKEVDTETEASSAETEDQKEADQTIDESDSNSKDNDDKEEVEIEDPKKLKEIEDNIKSIKFVEGPSDRLYDEERKNSDPAAADLGVPKPKPFTEWKYPTLELLESNEKKPKLNNLEENADIIRKTLHNFGIEVEIGNYNVGPTVTQYTFRPAVGVKLSKILSLQNDLALALAAHPIRIEAPIPGKSLVGVEVPNRTKAMVRMRSMLGSQEFQTKPSKICLALGEDVNGGVEIANIEKMPHLMIAGSTGTGKSVCINSILTTLLYQNSPAELRLILVDPKRVELTMFNQIPHLLTPVIVENAKVVNALKWAVGEMERRYKLLQEHQSRDIQSFNSKVDASNSSNIRIKKIGSEEEAFQGVEKLPYIIIVIDELADLMAAHAKEVEGLIVRLAQMARAVGIHLIVSTQRPSVEVLTGLIKANITTRIAFQVATQIDSRTILDMSGAEKLLGNGDLLFLSANSAQPKRIQGVYISEKEVKKVVSYIKKQAEQQEPDTTEELFGNLESQLENVMGSFSGSGTEGETDDTLYEEAKRVVIESKKASTSLLQRRLRIGYSRAARLIDLLEENGIVSPPDGSKPRMVLMKSGDTDYADPVEDQVKREDWQ